MTPVNAPDTADVDADARLNVRSDATINNETTEADVATVAPINVVAASVTGQKHLRREQGNQDSMFVGSRRDGLLCLIAADGAGSARCAKQGSSLAVHLAANIIAEATLPKTSSPTYEDDWYELLLTWLECVRTQMTTWSHDHNEQCSPKDVCTLQDLSTTLLMAVVTSTHLAAVQVGDGGIIAVAHDDQPYFVTEPYHGEYVGETVFITSPSYLEHASVKVLARASLRGLAVMTDGLEAVAIQQPQNHDQHGCARQHVPFAEFFEPLFAFATNPVHSATTNPVHSATTKSQQLTAFLTSDRLSARSDDDKTLILASWGS